MTDNLYDLLLDKLEGTPYSNYFMADCPFHDWQSHNRSLMVHEDGFKCLSCGKFGGLKSLAVAVNRDIVHGRDIKKHASNILPRWSKWERNYGTLLSIATHAHLSLKKFPQFQSYFKQRKIDQFIDKGFFGYLDGWNLFPVTDKTDKIVDIVVRAGTGKGDTRYVLHPDSNRDSPYLYVPSWPRVIASSVVYVVYGIIDAWTMEELGLPCVTGTSGKSLNYKLLKELDKKFVIVPDKNEDKDACNLANKLGWRAEVLILRYPDSTKDPDGIRIKYGKETLRDMIHNSSAHQGIYE